MATPIEPVPDAVLPPPPPPPPVVEAAALPKSEDLLVSGLEQIKGYEAFGKFDGQMYAGLLPMDNGNRTGKIMFWLFEPAQQTFDNSMVMWLNGGRVVPVSIVVSSWKVVRFYLFINLCEP